MTTPQDPPAGGDGNASGDADPTKSPTVTRDAYERLLGEKKGVAAKLQAQETELQAFRDAKKKREEDEAKARNEHEAVIAARDKELAEERAKRLTLESERQEQRKYAAFVRGLGTQIDSKFMPLIDLDKIKVDDAGQPDAASVTQYVADFRKQYPETVKASGGGAPPATPPQGSGGNALTYAQWLKLPLKEQRARIGDVKD